MRRIVTPLLLISIFNFLITCLAHSQNLSWPDPVANHVVPYQSLGITHGPVLGGVTDSSVKVWSANVAPLLMGWPGRSDKGY